MKLKHLWLSKYKNIENLDLSFNSNLVTLLIGKNGIGKSNLIEAITLIFRDLNRLSTEGEFVAWTQDINYFEYKIIYDCADLEIKIESCNKKFSIETRKLKPKAENKFSVLDFSEFIKNRKDKYLPKYIIGYYSGVSQRISELITESEKEEFEKLRIWHRKSGNEKKEDLRKLFYLRGHHSQMLLLTLALYKDNPDFKAEIDIYKEYLKITSIENITIHFHNPDWNFLDLGPFSKGMDELTNNLLSDVENPFWNVKGKLNTLLFLLYNHQEDTGMRQEAYDDDEVGNKERIRSHLKFSNLKIEEIKKKIWETFKHPLDFFDTLDKAYHVGILGLIKFKVIKENIKESIDFVQLSEGEQQLLIVLSLIQITGKDDCLFLLDEPDTHLNPAWQRQYVDLITNCNLNDENSHIIIATHSPLIVQSSINSEVILFKRETSGITVEESMIKYENWSLDHVLTSKYFDVSARPYNKRLDIFMQRRNEILKKETISSADKKFLLSFEDEIGILPTGESYEDMEMLQFVRKVAKLKGYDKDR